MNYCSLDLSNQNVQNDYLSLKNADSLDSLINIIGGPNAQFIGQMYETDDGDFHFYQKKDIVELLNKLLYDKERNLNLTDSMIYNLIRNYNAYFAKTKSDVLDDVRFNQVGTLISILSPALNDALLTDLTAEMNKLLVYDPNTNYIPIGSDGLNTAIKQYKNRLFRDLIDYIGSDETDLAYNELYDMSGDAIPLLNYYKDVLEKAYNKLKEQLRLQPSGKFQQVLDLKTRRDILKPVKALYVLNDFDNFIKIFSKGEIIINSDLIDKLEVLDKYTSKEHALRTKDFKDDAKSHDATDELSGKFYRFWQTISDGKGGYLSKHDFHAVRKFIENEKNDTEALSDFNGDLSVLSRDDVSLEEKVDALLNILTTNTTIREKIGVDICKNIVHSILQFRTDYTNKKQDTSLSIDERKELEQSYAFHAQMLYEMLLARNSAYQEVTPEGLKIESNSRVSKGKSALNTDVENHIREAFENGDYYLFNPRFVIPGTETEISEFTNVFSDQFIEYVRNLTGIDLMAENVRNKVDNPTGASKLAKFLVTINRIVKLNIQPYLNSAILEQLLFKTMSQLRTNGDYIEFTNLLIDDNLNNQQLLHGQQLETLPGVTVSNTVSKFAENWEKFKEFFGEDNGSIFNQFKGLTQTDKVHYGKVTGYTDRIIKRQDYAIQSKGVLRYLKGRQLVAAESATIALNYDFLDSICKYSTFLNQIECVSDKPSIPLGAFNMNAEKDGKSMLDMTFTDLYKCYELLHNSYYLKIRENLISDYSKIFGKQFASLDDAIEELENTTYDQLYLKLYDYNSTHTDHVELVNQIHYVATKENTIPLKFNASLYLNIKAVDDPSILKEIFRKGYNNFKDFLAKNGVPVVLEISSKYADVYKKLSDAQDFDFENFSKVFKEGSLWVAENGKTSEFAERLLRKFFVLQQIATDADLQVTVKDPLIHTVKGSGLSVSTLKTLSGATLNNEEFKSLFKELSDRLVKGKKRNNALVASYQEMLQGLDFGVANTMNVAFIESPVTDLLNFNGDTKGGQESHDGGALTNPIFNVWEKHSYLGRKFHDTKKAIGLFVNDSSFTQVKYADFTMNNYMIANSFRENGSTDFDCLSIMRKMNNYDASELMRKYNEATFHPALTSNLYRKINGELYKVSDFKFNDPEFGSTVIWRSVANPEVTYESDITENTVYGLWEAFGGYHSLSYIDDVLQISDASCEIVADLISLYEPSLKTKIIAKLVDKTGCKSCDVNLNTLDSLYNNRFELFLYYTADTSRMGIQQDATHDADESQIPALTLVLTALAFNGENIDLVNSVYETLGLILDESLKPLRNLVNQPNKHAFNKYVAEKLLKSLSTSSVQSNALNIVAKSLEEIYKDKTGKASIPYSSRQLFSKIASDFISGLNNDSLRLKFAGVAIIQNPSHGIIGIWEDKDGVRYTREDLEELAYENGYIGPEGEQAIEFALNLEQFQADEEHTELNSFSIGDAYELYYTNEDGEPVIDSGIIESPNDYLYLQDMINKGAGLYRNYSHQRDLRACNITFRDDSGILYNLWTLDSTQKKIKSPNDKLVKLYYKANLRGIGDKVNPFFFKEQKDFLDFLQAGGFDVEGNNIGKTFITANTVNYKAGEQIIPNVNRTKQGIDKSVSYILRHPEYFRNKVEQDLKNVSKVHPFSDESFVITLTNKSREIVYTTNPASNTSIPVYGKAEEDSAWLYNSLGQKLLKLPYEGKVNIEEYNEGGKQVTIVYLDPNQLTKENIQEVVRTTQDVQAYYYEGSNSNGLGSFVLGQNDFDIKHLDRTIAEQSKKLYNSFKLSLQTISARIPSQSFQSFMANDTVAFMPGNTNDGYVNIWQIWFQGSDYDIDKAYTMMYELDKHGLIATTSSLSQTDSAEAIERSLYLPKSNTSLLIDVDSKFRYIDVNQGVFEDAQINPDEKILPNNLLGTVFEKVLNKYVPVLIQNRNLVKVTTIEQLDQWLPTTDGRTRASFYIDFLNALNEYSEGKKLVWVNTYNIDINNLPAGFNGISATREAIITWVQVMSEVPDIPKLVLDLNRHNEKSLRSREMQTGLRNRVMAGMRLIATDIHNLESATQPMDMAPVTGVIDIYESKYKPEIAGRKYDYISPVTKWMIQYENAVGKEDVGIAANAIKADGAIQQRYNMLFANTSAEEAKNLAINLDLDLAYGDRRIFSKHFVKWANVKCTKEQFVTMLQEADLQNDYEYQILSGNKNYDQRIIDEVISDWNLFRKLNPYATLEDNYIDFLWFRTNFENNAADYLSIFISMATDNAKELALARLHASPDLMSMPLTMIALGMDINSVVDICVNLLDIIAKDLEQNRFLTGYKKADIREIIRNHTNKEFNQSTGESLLKIYNAAQEMRNITSFFKVNQGITANYQDLLHWLDGLSGGKIERDKNLTDAEKNIINRAGLSEFIGAKINFGNLLTNKDGYADRLQTYCELTKVGVNYIDIIRTSPHFRALLEGVNFMTKLIENNSFVAKLAQMALTNNELDEKTIDTPTEEESDMHINDYQSPDLIDNTNKITTFGNIDKSNAYRRMTLLGYHYATGIVLDRLSQGKDRFGNKSELPYRLIFKKSDVDAQFTNESNKQLGLNTLIDVSTNQGIDYFVEIVENQVIPYLKNTYRDNLFVRALEKEKDWETGRVIYGCKYDVFGRAEDLSDADKLNQVMRQFSQIMRNDSKVKTIDGHNLSIGEIMYLYALITTKDRICALNTILRPVSEYSVIPTMLENVNKMLDNIVQTETSSGKDDSIVKANILNKFGFSENELFTYSQALLSKDKKYGGIDLSKGFVLTKIPIEKQLTLKEFDEKLQKEINGVVTLRSSISDNVIELLISVKQDQIDNTFKFTYANAGNSKETIKLDAANVQHMINVITDNTKSIFNIISDLELSGIEEINLYGTLKENLEKILPKDALISKLLETIPVENKTVVIKNKPENGKVNRSFFTTYETSIDTQTIIVLKDDALSVNSEELIDLLLQLQVGNDKADKLVALVKLIDPESTVTKLTVENYVNDSGNSILYSYLRYLDELELDQEYKNLCLRELSQFETALQYPELYYAHTLSNKILNGDRFVDSKGNEYLCLGKKRANKYTFILLNNASVSESFGSRVNGENLTKIAELKLFQNYILETPFKITGTYNDEKSVNVDEVTLKDIIINDGKQYTVVQIVFDGTERQLIGYDPLSKQFELFTGKVIAKLNIINDKSVIKGYRLDNPKTTIQGNESIKITNALTKLQSNDVVISDGKKYMFYQAINPELILVKNGNDILQLSINDIDELQFAKEVVLDKEFKLISEPQTILGKWKGIQEYLGAYTVEENTDWQKDNKEHVWQLLDQDGYFVRHLSNYTQILSKEYIPKESDLVAIKTNNKEELYKLMSNDGNGNWIVNILNNNTTTIKSVPESIILNSEKKVYSKLEESKKQNVFYTGEQNLSLQYSDNELGNAIIDQLQDTFGLNILLDRVDETQSAMLDGRKIIINLARCPETMTPGQYIAKCSIHEFTHLALANLQAHFPEMYFALIDYVKTLSTSIPVSEDFDYNLWSQIKNNPMYESETEEYEEYIVRYVDKFVNLDIKPENMISNALNQGFANLLKIDPEYFKENNWNNSIGGLIQIAKRDFFGETSKTFNMKMIENESVALKEFDKIERICK